MNERSAVNSLTRTVVEVLTCGNNDSHLATLAARLIAADLEINHILARTKGLLEGSAWFDYVVASDRDAKKFIEAWAKFKARVADNPGPRRSPNPGERQMCQEAVDGIEVVLERLRGELAALGRRSWIYEDDE